MIAVDSNVLVRLVTWDDVNQSPRAKHLFAIEDVFVGTTVLLETEWVLRHIYKLDTAGRSAALRGVIGLPGVTIGDPVGIATALDLMDAGMDFADAVHLQAAEGCEALISFDRDFAKTATRLGTPPVRAP